MRQSATGLKMTKAERTANLANKILEELRKHVDLDEILSGHTLTASEETSIAIAGLTAVIGRVTALAVVRGHNEGLVTNDEELDKVFDNVHDQLEISMMAEIESMQESVSEIGNETELTDIEKALMNMDVENKNRH